MTVCPLCEAPLLVFEYDEHVVACVLIERGVASMAAASRSRRLWGRDAVPSR